MERTSCVWLKDEAQKGVAVSGEGGRTAVLQLGEMWG